MSKINNLVDLAQGGDTPDSTAPSDLSGQPSSVTIGLRGKNSYDYLVCYLGVLKAGMVAEPINCKLPDEVMHFAITDADMAFQTNAVSLHPQLEQWHE